MVGPKLDLLYQQSKTILIAVPKLAKNVITNAPNTMVDRAKKPRDHLRDVEVGL